MARRLVILGAGPIGLEAALLGAKKGFDVQVFEQDEIAQNVRNWSHVTLFSSWGLNRSVWGEDSLRSRDIELDPSDQYPTGAHYLERYLEPLASDPLLKGRIHTQHVVYGVSRADALKGDFIANPERAKGKFLIHVEDQATGEERYEEADLIFDTTGVYEIPNALGPGGLPALGEMESDIERYVPDVLGEDRVVYEGQHTLLIGAGYSAVTSAKALADLAKEVPGTKVSWLMRSEDAPYEVFEEDSLPQRVTLTQFGNAAARGEVEAVEPKLGAYVHAVRQKDHGGGYEVTIKRGGKLEVEHYDQVIANVGYRPDLELARELQVHLCYASEGPMKLAATLLGDSGGDCMAAASGGIETLQSPEPDFFVLGSKSYGRNSAFLLKLGFEQIGTVFEFLAERDEV